MKEENLNLPPAGDPAPEEEPWLSKHEIMKLFDVTDRQLVYWRTYDRITYKTVKNLTFYKASTIRAELQKARRPKKSWWYKKRRKIKSSDIIIAIVIPILGAWFLLLDPFKKEKVYTQADINFVFIFILIVPATYGLLKLIQYIWKRYFRKNTIKD